MNGALGVLPGAILALAIGIAACDNPPPVPMNRIPVNVQVIEATTPDGTPLDVDRPTCAAFSSRGHIAICEQADHEIIFLDSVVQERWRFGRKGRGPGEFRTISSIAVDSLGRTHLFDGLLKKLVLLSSDGKLVADRSAGYLSGFSPKLLGELADGRLVFLRGTLPSPGRSSGGIEQFSSSIQIADSTAQDVVRVDSVALGEQFTLGSGFQQVSVGVPFGASGYAVLAQDAVVSGFARDSFLVRRNLLNTRIDTISINAPAFPIARASWDSAVEVVPKGAEEFGPNAIAARSQMPRQERYPRYYGLLATPRGTIAIYAPADVRRESYEIRCAFVAEGDVCPGVSTTGGDIVLAISSGRALVARHKSDGDYRIQLWILKSGTMP